MLLRKGSYNIKKECVTPPQVGLEPTTYRLTAECSTS